MHWMLSGLGQKIARYLERPEESAELLREFLG